MRLHQFVLILDQAPDCDQVAVVAGRYTDIDIRLGDASVTVRRRAAALAGALVSAVHDLEAVDLYPVRVFCADWVTLAHIGQRIGRSRELVRLWSVGRQGPGGFPPPVNPGRDTRFYSWAEVSTWLREQAGYDLPDEEPVLTVMNLLLQVRHLAPRITNTGAIGALLSSR